MESKRSSKMIRGTGSRSFRSNRIAPAEVERAEEKVQLEHPQGKKAVRITKDKYDLIRGILVAALRKHGPLTHSALLQRVEEELRMRRLTFEGSLSWYVEWVKLDLVAKKIVRLVPNSAPQEYRAGK